MIYEYVCELCKNKEEIMCPVAERDNQVCVKCSTPLSRIISKVSSQWKTDCPTSSKGRMVND